MFAFNIDLIIKSFVFNPFPNKPYCLHVYCKSLLKTLWEKEKLPLFVQFLLFPQCFTCLEYLLPFSSNLELSSANSFSLGVTSKCRLKVVWERVNTFFSFLFRANLGSSEERSWRFKIQPRHNLLSETQLRSSPSEENKTCTVNQWLTHY